MAASHLAGGTAKRQREDEDAAANSSTSADPSLKRRRQDVTNIDSEAVSDCVKLTKTNSEWRGAIRHIKRCVLSGGVRVKLSDDSLYHGYTKDAEKFLMENLERVLEWRLTLGFVLVMMYRRESVPVVEVQTAGPARGDSSDDSDGDAAGGDRMLVDGEDADMRALAEGVAPPVVRSAPVELGPEDLEFIVPSLGYGKFRCFFDTQQFKYKVDYIRTEDEKKREELACFVFTEEEPVRRAVPSAKGAAGDSGQGVVTAFPASPAARLTAHARMLDNYLMRDEKGTDLATDPIPIAQERPPVKVTGALASGGEYSYRPDGQPSGVMSGRAASQAGPANSQQSFGKPHASGKPVAPMGGAHPNAPASTNKSVMEAKDRTYYMEPGYVFSGLITPHAYPRISDRRNDFLTLVSMETSVPAHVIQPGKPPSNSTGSGMTGSAAGGKKPQAAGTKQASGANQQSSSSSGGFNADPSFNTALEMREFLQNFFQVMMGVKNGEKLRLYVLQQMESNNEAMSIKMALAADLEKLIAEAKAGVVNYSQTITDGLALQQETRQLEAETRRDVLRPENVAKTADANGTSSTADKPGKPGPISMPEGAGEAEAAGGGGGGDGRIPVAPEVQALTTRRLEVQADMDAIARATEQYNAMMAMERPVSLEFRQPIINDTANIEHVIELLGLPPEQSHEIALRRFGLLL